MKNLALIAASTVLLSQTALAVEGPPAELEGITNFRQYSATFASAGQPTADQLQAIADQGFERIVYIAFTNNTNALPDEDQIVKGLGMEYMQVPVDFSNPLLDDFYAFADSMQRNTGKKTLLHCQVNARATAFSFLYRVLYEDVPIAEAKEDMNTVWQPNEVWRDFIFEVMAQNDKDPNCEGCDWTPPPPRN
ncbi:MAG TPA: phosphatase [Gammaproteobacteria bacterium]|nr:phosphatase [Gammaproteobacteria bacterium]RPG46042.1 MAG: phosphatase [Gammaproteobacteria bacterium TMED163]HAO88588.1 phosphatase [Gammaproteobacteria bacterium]HAR90895.1 phosphatase [Gammaproteobacteria bacterium]HBP98980.1 phosphatase [Gammaproteobacteria bacterium]|tara:strand:- start:18 stop:593 length:576 start_codon:yes stop_codon:yes gene_type:complete